MSLLTVKDLKVNFTASRNIFGKPTSRVHAVDGVSFELAGGQTLGLVGESGCGKSTLGRAILRLVTPDQGQVHFAGKNVLTVGTAELRHLRKEMQLIFQDPFSSLNPRMTVGQILAEPFVIHEPSMKAAERTKRVSELLDLVGLPQPAMHRLPHQFSGGQRQRIGIARAIALKPKLIIADEPVSALDVSIQSQILNLLADLKKQLNLSYIFIAHDLAVVEHVSDMIAVMYLGRIIEYAPASSLYKTPLHPYTHGLIQAIPKPVVMSRKSLQNKQLLGGDVPSPINPPSGCHLNPRCPRATAICKEVVPLLSRKTANDTQHLVACHHAG